MKSAVGAARQQRLLWPLAVLFVGAVCLFWFFGPAILSGFRLLLGELGDTRFCNVILEHWWTFWRADRNWKSPPFFFPEQGVLAYSDALFLFTPFYGLARATGLTPYYAQAAMVACLLLFGYLSTLWLLRRVFGIERWVSLLGAAIYAFAGMRLRSYGHVQLFAALFLPLLLGAAVIYLEQLKLGSFGLRQGLLLAIGVAGLLFTSFYVGWFFILFLALAALCYVLLDATQCGLSAVRTLLNRRTGASLSLAGAALILALLPFLSLYLPRFSEFGPRPWLEVAELLPTIADLVNVGSGNLVWGEVIQRLVPARPREYEIAFTFGLPLALMGIFLVTSAVLLLFPKEQWLGGINAHPKAKVLRAFALAVLLIWLLTIVWEGRSMWWAVYRFVPGGTAIRAVFRFQVVLYLSVVVVSMCGLAAVWRASSSRLVLQVLLVGLCALLVTEQIERTPVTFDARAETARIQNVQPPPAYCRHFVLLGDAVHPRGPWELNIDAAMLALHARLPTVNGYSGNFPRGWGLPPISIGYESAVAEWVARHDIEQGLCTFSAANGTWRRVIPADSYDDLIGKNLVTLNPGNLEDALKLKRLGFHILESDGRWTDGLGTISFSTPLTAQQIRISGTQSNPLVGPVRIFIDGRLRYSETLPQGPFAIVVPVDGSVREIQIDSATFVPRLLGLNEDSRQLGIVVNEVVVE